MTDRTGRLYIRISIRWCFLIAFLLCGCIHTDLSQVTRQKEKITELPVSWHSSVILLENRTELAFEVHRGGNRVKRKDSIWAYVAKRNPNQLERINIVDIETYEKPVIIKATAYFRDGARWLLPRENVKRRKIPFSNAFSNEFRIPGYDEGVLIHLETERYYFRPEFIGTFILRSEYPTRLRSISFAFPDDCNLAYGLENPEGTNVEESLIVEDGQKIIEIQAKDIDSREERWETEFPAQWYAAFYVSFPPKGKRSYTWQELGDHYLDLSKDAFESSPEIEALSESVKGTTQPELIESAFSTVVGKIRYHADEEGRFAFFPRKATTILSNGYGDCKEISTLLKTLLHAKAVEAHLALISTRNKMQTVAKYPSLDNFNHVILAVGTKTGRYRFLDGTQTWADANSSYYSLIGRTAFLLRPQSSQLARVTADESYKNRVVTREKVDYDAASGRWVIDGHIQLSGRAALRFFSRLNWSDTMEKKSLAKRYLQEYFGIYPLTFEFAAPDSNSAFFNFKAPFQENYISIDKGGFRLAVPRLFSTAVNESLGEKKGPRQLESFEQQDTWEFDRELQFSRMDGFHLPFANCSYSVQGSSLTRTYTQDNKLFQQNGDQLEIWLDKIKSTMNSTCWSSN